MDALRTVMSIQAVVLLIYGLPMLLVPSYWTTLTQQAPLPENYTLRAIGIAFVILSYLEFKIAGRLEQYRSLALAYAALPALLCVTIVLQALKRGCVGASWYWWVNGVITAVFAIAVFGTERTSGAA